MEGATLPKPDPSSEIVSNALAPTGQAPIRSVFRGVTWNKKNSRWQASIHVGKKYRYLGSFVEAEDAARAFDDAALRFRGSNCKLNFPDAQRSPEATKTQKQRPGVPGRGGRNVRQPSRSTLGTRRANSKKSSRSSLKERHSPRLRATRSCRLETLRSIFPAGDPQPAEIAAHCNVSLSIEDTSARSATFALQGRCPVNGPGYGYDRDLGLNELSHHENVSKSLDLMQRVGVTPVWQRGEGTGACLAEAAPRTRFRSSGMQSLPEICGYPDGFDAMQLREAVKKEGAASRPCDEETWDLSSLFGSHDCQELGHLSEDSYSNSSHPSLVALDWSPHRGSGVGLPLAAQQKARPDNVVGAESYGVSGDWRNVPVPQVETGITAPHLVPIPAEAACDLSRESAMPTSFAELQQENEMAARYDGRLSTGGCTGIACQWGQPHVRQQAGACRVGWSCPEQALEHCAEIKRRATLAAAARGGWGEDARQASQMMDEFLAQDWEVRQARRLMSAL